MAIEPVNERPIFPQLYQPNAAGVSMWSVSMIRQLTTVFQQYGYRLNRTLLAGGLTTNANTLTASGGYVLTENATGTPLADTLNIAVLHANTSTDDDPQRMGAIQIAFVSDSTNPATYRRSRDNDAADVDDWGAWEQILTDSTAGAVLQHAFASTGEVVSTTNIIPYDDTIPQITEGGEALSINFTPKRADSRLRIRAVGNLRGDTAANVGTVTVCVSTQSDALAVGHAHVGGSTLPIYMVPVVADIASPGTSQVTFSLRFGSHAAGTMYINATNTGVRRYGGASATTLEVTEYIP